MTERRALLESIAVTTKDYRVGEIPPITADHVERWNEQFSTELRVPILRELNPVLTQTYFSQKRVKSFLKGLIGNKQLAGDDPCSYWKSAHFLDIQQNGASQNELLAVFSTLLEDACGVATAECGAKGGDFIYIDDVLFSGSRIGNDLEPWIRDEAPANGVIQVIVIAVHASGEWMVSRRLKKAISESGKQLTVNYWRAKTLENRRTYRRDAEVLWPAGIPEEEICQDYIQMPHKFPFEPRPDGGNIGIFSSEEGRRLLEREFLLAGLRIRRFCASPSSVVRPLGFSSFGLGFGSLIVTYRNCPNNCPLALWWGDANAKPGHPFSKWYPLFPRKTYNAGAFGL